MPKHFVGIALTVPAAVLLLTACSSAPESTVATGTVSEAKKEPPPPPEPVAAKTAFWEMYKPARAWAPDLLPLSLAANEAPGVKNDAGKAAVWTAVFVSPNLRQARTYYYAVADSPVAPKGVTARAIQTWTGATRDSRPFQINDLAVNSDAAWKTAADKAGPWLKKHPDKTATISLVNGARFAAPAWFIMWGDKKDGYAAFVNAMTGAIMNVK